MQFAESTLQLKDEILNQALEAISLLQEETGIEECDLEAIEAAMTSDDEDEFGDESEATDEESEGNANGETEVS